MPFTRLNLLASTVLLAPVLALAQDQGAPHSPTNSLLYNILLTLFPFGLFALVIYWFLRRTQSSPQSKRLADYMTRHEQNMARQEHHMARLEDSLERIAKALEKRDTH